MEIQNARDKVVFEQATRAYEQVGLVSHPGKRQRQVGSTFVCSDAQCSQFLDSIFHEGAHGHPDDVFKLSPQSLNEMRMLMLLRPLVQSDLPVEVCL